MPEEKILIVEASTYQPVAGEPLLPAIALGTPKSESVYPRYSGIGLGGSIHSTGTNVPSFTNQDLLGQTVIAYPTDPTGCLTVKISSGKFLTAPGFKAKLECVSYCQYPVAALDTFFYKISPDGTKTKFAIRRFSDTVFNITDSNLYDVVNYKAIDICNRTCSL